MSHEEALQSALLALKGKPAWGLARTYGSMFFLEIGEPLPRSDEKKIHGEWHFLIEMCHWRIEAPEEVIIGSDDEQEVIDKRFASLVLGSIEGTNVPRPSHDLEIFFTSGTRLTTFSAAARIAEDCAQWQLFLPDDTVCMAIGSGKLLCKNAHA